MSGKKKNILILITKLGCLNQLTLPQVLLACVAASSAKSVFHHTGGALNFAPPATVHHANGAVVPADTPQVKAAKAAFQRAGGIVSAPVDQGPPAVVSYANGAITPADTPAVQAAKASHTMKVQAVKSAFQQAGGNLIPDASTAAVAYARTPIAIVSPLAAVAHTNRGFVAGLVGGAAHPVAFGGMVAHPNGVVVPAEPADVVAARHAHLKTLVTA